MLLDCQLKSLLKNYFKTDIVGFGKADALGYSLIVLMCFKYKEKSISFGLNVCENEQRRGL